MSREILFRAKRANWKELPKSEWWIEGYLMDENYINIPFNDDDVGGRFDEPIEIDPETVCEYIGKTDVNNIKIFDGDIVTFLDTYSTDSGMAEGYCAGTVNWDYDELCFYVTNRLSAESWEVLNECHVIGNIFDNPDLLEGGDMNEINRRR